MISADGLRVRLSSAGKKVFDRCFRSSVGFRVHALSLKGFALNTTIARDAMLMTSGALMKREGSQLPRMTCWYYASSGPEDMVAVIKKDCQQIPDELIKQLSRADKGRRSFYRAPTAESHFRSWETDCTDRHAKTKSPSVPGSRGY